MTMEHHMIRENICDFFHNSLQLITIVVYETGNTKY